MYIHIQTPPPPKISLHQLVNSLWNNNFHPVPCPYLIWHTTGFWLRRLASGLIDVLLHIFVFFPHCWRCVTSLVLSLSEQLIHFRSWLYSSGHPGFGEIFFFFHQRTATFFWGSGEHVDCDWLLRRRYAKSTYWLIGQMCWSNFKILVYGCHRQP